MEGLTRTAGRRARGAAGLLLPAAILLATAAPAAAADPVDFGTPTASSTFGTGIDFEQPIDVTGPIKRVEILLATPGAEGPTVQPVPGTVAGGGSTLHYHLDLSNGQVVPNTPFVATWRLTAADGSTLVGPAVRVTYDDDRYKWQTLKGDVVRVHWTRGDTAFGRRAAKIGDDAIAAASALLGVTESDPIDFFIYADQGAFYDALGPGTRENVGGQAHPDIRTLFALITPDEINDAWVSTVVPHELTHVVFQTAVDNPYHDPPHWLNEGLAVYLSAGYQDSDRRQVQDAAKAGTIIPLDGLAGAFPTQQARFFLAYAESVSAVDRIVRVNGRDALVKLIRSYAKGVSDDEAFQAAISRDMAGFQADWLAELGATAPPRVGPRAAPAGPLPPGWTGPQPNPSFDVSGPIPDSPRLPGRTGDFVATVLAPSAGVLGLALLAVLAILIARRGRRAAPPGAEPGWNRLYGRPVIADDPLDVIAPDHTSPPVPAEPTRSSLEGIHFGPDEVAPRDGSDGTERE